MSHPPDCYVLGISAYFHDSAAALVRNGEVLAAAQEERFTRRKADWSFPNHAIAYCLSRIPGDAELHAVAFYENPILKMDRILSNAVAKAPRGVISWRRTLQTLQALNRTLPEELTRILPDPERIFFTAHHRAHAASAFYPSPFDEAVILVADGVGEWATTSIWHGQGSNLERLKEIKFPHSLGLLYSAFTQYCGFRVNSGEYKLMGLASFGVPIYKPLIYEYLVNVDAEGGFTLNSEYFGFETGLSSISPLFQRLFGYPPRQPDEPISMHYMNIAASIQTVINEMMLTLANTALRMTGSSHLCLAGGIALNCVTNTVIARQAEGLEGIWVQPAAGDAGGALGAALDISHALQESAIRPAKGTDGMAHAYLGPAYNDEQIIDAMERRSLEWEDYSEREQALRETVSLALQDGNIVGYFDGRMEFGPRALGHRSILADPRPVGMLQRANKKIKFRESWRPFAPIVLAEHEDTFFDTAMSDPYMLFVSELKERYWKRPDLREMRARGLSDPRQYLKHPVSDFPAVTHFDHSSRTQSLHRAANPRLHAILTDFYDRTGCPMLLNTSFNVRGEPIVCTPTDAIDAFLNTHLDMLVIGPYLVKRKAQSKANMNIIGRKRFHAD